MPAGCEQLLRTKERSQIGCILITGDKIGRFLVRAVEIFTPSQWLSEEALSAAAAVSECSHSFVSVGGVFPGAPWSASCTLSVSINLDIAVLKYTMMSQSPSGVQLNTDGTQRHMSEAQIKVIDQSRH